MTRDEKLRIARQLERLKVDVIEAGFAASSNGDFECVKAIAEVIKSSRRARELPQILWIVAGLLAVKGGVLYAVGRPQGLDATAARRLEPVRGIRGKTR